MAGTGRRTQRQTSNQRAYRSEYIEGNTVRKVQAVPNRQPRPIEPPRRSSVSTKTKKNREKALQMNLGYVMFLTVAAAMLLLVCVQYIQLRTETTNNVKKIASLENSVMELKTQNDARYNSLMADVDLEEIARIAIEELGMVYATQEQVVIYSSQDSDYVRQYKDIPKDQ